VVGSEKVLLCAQASTLCAHVGLFMSLSEFAAILCETDAVKDCLLCSRGDQRDNHLKFFSQDIPCSCMLQMMVIDMEEYCILFRCWFVNLVCCAVDQSSTHLKVFSTDTMVVHDPADDH